MNTFWYLILPRNHSERHLGIFRMFVNIDKVTVHAQKVIPALDPSIMF